MSDGNSDEQESSQKEYEDKAFSNHYRRDCLQYLGGSLMVLGGISRASAESSGPEKPIDEGPEPYSQTGSIPGDFSSDVYFIAPTELPLLVSKVEQYNEERDPDIILHPALKRQLENHDSGEINLLIRTIGERIETTSNDTPQRDFFGFRCTPDEVSELAKYGDVVSTPQFATTKLSLHNVNVDKLEEIANLPFVLEVNYEPKLTLDLGETGNPEESPVHIDSLRKKDYHRYSEIDGDWEVSHKIGYIDNGYRGDGHGPFSESYAEEYGFINGGEADDFHPGWDNPDDWDGFYHGDASMDLGAYMLGEENVPDSVEPPMVPLYVHDNSQETAIIKDAIRHAMYNGIPVLSASWGTENNNPKCPSIFCDLLHAYTLLFGGIFVSATGNNYDYFQVDYPGGEYLSIGVGAVDDKKAKYPYDYEVRPSSNHGGIYLNECEECYMLFDNTKFSPNVYGYGAVRDDNWELYRDTSAATAQVSITALMMISVGNLGYKDVVAIFDSMDRHKIYPDDAARAGQFNDAEYAYKKSPHRGNILGDANASGEISIRDSTLIQQELVGMEPEELINRKGLADVAQTGEISIRDSTLIKQHLVGMDVDTELKLNSIDVDDPNPPFGSTIEISTEITNDNDDHEFGAVGPITLNYDRATTPFETHSRKWIDLEGGESQTYQFLVDLPTDIDVGEELTFTAVAGEDSKSTSVTIAPPTQ